jgi:TIR domain
MDIDSIEIGLDFEKVIAKSLAQCQVMLVVIGRSWLNAVDASGRARLESPGDYVRIEIQEALQRDIRVIPILVNGAPIPIDAELPPLMRSLTRRNGIEVSHASFNADVERLIRILERILSE